MSKKLKPLYARIPSYISISFVFVVVICPEVCTKVKMHVIEDIQLRSYSKSSEEKTKARVKGSLSQATRC